MIEEARGAERRQARRYPVRLPITVVVSGGPVPGVRGHTVDISSRGLRVVTDADLEHGVEQTVILEAPGQPIVAGADLVWTQPRGEQWVHGLVLGEMAPGDEERLARLCAERI